MKNFRSNINTYLLFTIIMSIAFMLSIWRIKYGFGGYDEPFYLTVPHRLFMGDSLLSEEWHVTQLSSVLLFPFVALYELITKTTDGIILYMRVIYTICHALVSVLLYVRLKNYKYGAIFTSVLYFLFSPYGMKTLSYNTIALDALVLTAVFASTFNDKHKIIHTISGITFSMAVLCCPYMAVVYIIYCLCVSVHFVVYKFIIKKNNEYSFNVFSIRRFLYFSLGILISLTLFLSFVLSRVSINEVLENIPYILFGDPEHIGFSILDKTKNYFGYIFNCANNQIFITVPYILLIIALIIDKRRKQHRKIYLTLSIIVTAIILIMFSGQLNELYYNAIMFPLLFTGITSYILCDKKYKDLFTYFFIMGLLYSFIVNISSNQNENVIFTAMSVSNIASIIFTFQLIFEISSEKVSKSKINIVTKSICIISVYAVMFLQGFLQIYVFINHYYWEATVTSQQVSTTDISEGIAKGITVTSDKALEYYQVKYDLDYYKYKKPDKILFFSHKTWEYLFLDKFENASYSAWLSGLSYTTVERLNSYYKIHPDKLPTYIYIDKGSAELYNFDLSNVYSTAIYYGYSIAENEISYKLDKIH